MQKDEDLLSRLRQMDNPSLRDPFDPFQKKPKDMEKEKAPNP